MRSHSSPFRSLVCGVVGITAIAAPVALGQTNPERNPPGSVMASGTDAATTRAVTAGLPPITPTTPDMKAVQDLLGRAAEDATTPGRGSDLLHLLSRSDRDRIGGGKVDWSDVDRAADGFRAAWQARFGLGFTLADKVSIVMSEPDVHVTGIEPAPGGSSTQPSHDRTTDVTVVLTDPGQHNTSRVHLVNEGPGGKVEWHFDLPDAATAASLHDALLRRLTAVTANQQRWPTDVDQAYVYVTQHVLSAVTDTAGR